MLNLINKIEADYNQLQSILLIQFNKLELSNLCWRGTGIYARV